MAGRILGFVTRPSREVFPVVLQNCRDASSGESLDTQGEDGKTDNQFGMRKTRTITADGEVLPTAEGKPPEFPEVLEIMKIGEGESQLDFLIKNVEQTAAAGQTLKCSITIERKDDATITPYSEVHKAAQTGS